jgi:hypothetical protein
MIDHIEEILKSLLQKNIEIVLKNKTIKRGRLIIFRHIGCFIRLEIQTATKQDHIEIPFPYVIESKPGLQQFIFDYRLISLADGDMCTFKMLQNQKQVRENKYYDRILTINVTK